VTIRSLRLASAGLLLALLLPACNAFGGASPTLPSFAASAGGAGLEAFCALDLQNDPEVKAVVDAATSASTGGQVDEAVVAGQVDTAVAEIQAVGVSGEAATARDRLVDALNAFKADPSQATATAALSAHVAAVGVQDALCG
jgi:hypothetical protein